MNSTWLQLALAVTISPLLATTSMASMFDNYALAGSFELPANAQHFDVLNDGRLIAADGGDIYIETAVGSRSFNLHGTLPGTWDSSRFLRVSPDGTRFALDKSAPQVGVCDIATLSSTIFYAGTAGAEWYDNRWLMCLHYGPHEAPGSVAAVDLSSPDPTDPDIALLVYNVGTVCSGIAFDADGRLYTGTEYDMTFPESVGTVNAFDSADWMPALAGGPSLDFYTEGTTVIQYSNASSLGFDSEGNFHIGSQGAYCGVAPAALVRAAALADALSGLGPVDPADPTKVRQFDPNLSQQYDCYRVNSNPITSELYVSCDQEVWVYVPEPATALAVPGLLALACRRRA